MAAGAPELFALIVKGSRSAAPAILLLVVYVAPLT
jgi:hypothetical protein